MKDKLGLQLLDWNMFLFKLYKFKKISHLQLWVAVAKHNFKLVKMLIL